MSKKTLLQRNSSPFMEQEGSLSCSQEPATGPYREPHEFNPQPPTHILSSSSILFGALYCMQLKQSY
jgi:hypothetical protein